MGRCRVTFALSLYMLISPNPWNLLFSSASREFEGGRVTQTEPEHVLVWTG